MGCVSLGRDHQLGRHVAIKTLIAGADSDLVARFREEVMAVATIDHPNVLKVHQAGESEGRPYFVMEYVEGGSLGDYLAGKPQPARTAAARPTPTSASSPVRNRPAIRG